MRLYSFGVRFEDTGKLLGLGVVKYRLFPEIRHIMEEIERCATFFYRCGDFALVSVRDAAHLEQVAAVFSKCLEGVKK